MNKKPTAEEVLNHLRIEPTEGHLTDIVEDSHCIDFSHESYDSDDFFMGFYLVPVAEGFLYLPYENVLNASWLGYEQFVLDDAFILVPGTDRFEMVYHMVEEHLNWAQNTMDQLKRTVPA